MEDWTTRYAANMHDYAGYSIGKQLAMINDPEVISLAGGLPSPDTFPRRELLGFSQERLSRDCEKIMQYSAIKGDPDLIAAVIAYLRREEVRVGPENVLITSSGQQGLDLVGRLFLDPGDRIVVERPTFAGALAAFRMQRPVFLGIDLKDDGLDMVSLEDGLIRCRAEGLLPKFVYVVPDFQNPSGITLGLEKRLALLDLCSRFDLPIVEDSPYRTLRYRGFDLPSLFRLDQEKGGRRVIGVHTFSKIFCPGMRVGFLTGPAEVIARLTNIKEGNTLNTPKYNQDMCRSFLTEMDLEAYFRDCSLYYKQKLDLFQEAMEKYFPQGSGVTWTRPDGGLFVWVTCPAKVNTGKLFQKALDYKVAFVPGEACYGQNPEYNRMRLNFSYPAGDRLLEAVKRLSDCLFEEIDS
ncbi:MAG: PLP-dependent aminotransferase family protein [Desulfohalobiaceae bacterium]|nr:PLP-dependent aminotransferase family protein [Desulfohalobiaceae bacterium]